MQNLDKSKVQAKKVNVAEVIAKYNAKPKVTNKPISIRFKNSDADKLEEINKLAKKNKCSQSDMIRILILTGLDCIK